MVSGRKTRKKERERERSTFIVGGTRSSERRQFRANDDQKENPGRGQIERVPEQKSQKIQEEKTRLDDVGSQE